MSSVLSLYSDPDRLAQRLPVLRLLTRTAEEIRKAAERLQPAIAEAVESVAAAQVVDCRSEVGSGALPTNEIASAGVSVTPLDTRRAGTILNQIAAAFRSLPRPVIGRIQQGAFVLDMRCLDEEEAFLKQLPELKLEVRT